MLNFIASDVNEKLLLRTNRDNVNLEAIDAKYVDLYSNEYKQLARFSCMISSVQSNLSILKKIIEIF